MATEKISPDKAAAGGRRFGRKLFERYGHQAQYSVNQSPRLTKDDNGTSVEDPNLWEIIYPDSTNEVGTKEEVEAKAKTKAIELLKTLILSTDGLELMVISYIGIPTQLTGIKTIEVAERKVVDWTNFYQIFLSEVIAEITPHFPNGSSDSSTHFG